MDFWHPGAKNCLLVSICQQAPRLKIEPRWWLKWLRWVPACSSCSHIEQFKMIIWHVAVTQTEQVHHSQKGAQPPGSLSFARASVSSLSLHSSSAKFISPERPSYTSTLCTLPRESISSCQEKGKVPWGRFKEKLKLKVCNVVRAGERRGNVRMREGTVVEPWDGAPWDQIYVSRVSGIAGRVFTADPLWKPYQRDVSERWCYYQ